MCIRDSENAFADVHRTREPVHRKLRLLAHVDEKEGLFLGKALPNSLDAALANFPACFVDDFDETGIMDVGHLDTSL